MTARWGTTRDGVHDAHSAVRARRPGAVGVAAGAPSVATATNDLGGDQVVVAPTAEPTVAPAVDPTVEPTAEPTDEFEAPADVAGDDDADGTS